MHLSDQKEHLRQSIMERMKRMDDKDRHAEGRTISRQLLKHIPEGSTVCGYFPLKSEADIRLLLSELMERGDTVYLPRFEDQKLVFRQLTDQSLLEKDPLKIPAPPLSAPQADPATIDYVVVPGRAFDRAGARLGRGAGGYDGWIAKHRKNHPRTKFIGTCFECQLLREVPVEDHDEKMDAVVTAREIIEIKQ